MEERLNDNELMYMIRQMDQVALGLLMDKYSTIIDCKIAEIVFDKRLCQSQKEDLRQIGYILLNECVDSFNANLAVKFSTFFSFCFERKLRNQLRSYYAHNGQYLNSISLDQTVDENGEFTLGENTASVYPDYQADSLINYEHILGLIKKATARFSTLERSICNLRQDGYSYKEIGEELLCNYKKIDNTMQKFRRAMTDSLAKDSR